MTATSRRIEVLGIPVDAVDMSGAIAFAEQALSVGQEPACILAVNPEKVAALRKQASLLQFFHKSQLLIPDGIGVVWAARWLHGAALGRVPGADLMDRLCAVAARLEAGIYLLGATEEVNAECARVLQARHSGLRVAGRRNGFANGDASDLVRDINQSGASILFVALGSPRQEQWIAAHRGSLSVKIIQGVGGTFDVVAGRVKRAPHSFQRMHLEWLYRLASDPRRISRQRVLPAFVGQVLMEKVRRKAGP